MIKIHNLEKSFGNNHVLNGVNIEITRGECVCVIGPSGSGKSTFLRCINLLEQPDAGEILINGKDILKPGLDLDAFRANLGMVFQHFNSEHDSERKYQACTSTSPEMDKRGSG